MPKGIRTDPTVKAIAQAIEDNAFTKIILAKAVETAEDRGVSFLAAVQWELAQFNVFAEELSASSMPATRKVTTRRKRTTKKVLTENADTPKKKVTRRRRKKVEGNGRVKDAAPGLPLVPPIVEAVSTSNSI